MKQKQRMFAVILSAMFAFGALFMLIGYTLGAKKWVYMDPSGIHVVEPKPVQITDMELEKFTNLDIDIPDADITIARAEQYGIDILYSVDYAYDSPPDYTITDGTLKVAQEKAPFDSPRFYFMNMNLSFKTPPNQITIYIPNDAILDQLKASANSGNLTLRDVQAKQVTLTNAYGNVYADNITADTFHSDINDGNMTLNEIRVKEMTLSNDYGSITSSHMTADSLQATLRDGDFHIDNSLLESMHVTNHYGNIIAEELVCANTTALSNDGRINLTGTLTGSTNINAKYGSVTFTTYLPKEVYSYDITAKYGRVYLNGEQAEGEDSVRLQKNDSALANAVKIYSEDGNINLNFK